MTSAVDIIAPKPAVRPEPAAKASSRDDDRTSFADALDAEISEPEAPAKETAPKETASTKKAASKDEPATPDVNAAAQPAPPQQQQTTPAVNSPEAILAGLTQAAPADASTADAGAATPSIDATAPVAANTGAATPTTNTPASDATAAAAAAQGAAKPAAAPQPTAPQADAAAAEQTGDVATPKSAKKPAAPQTAQTQAPATPTTDDAVPFSAPGEERASATTDTAGAKSTATNNTAADPAANKTQGAQAKTTQVAANVAAEAAPDIKADAAPSSPAPTVDALASTRTGGAETTRAAHTTPNLPAANPTTVQVYQRMVERFDGRAQRYEIRLDPAELGRIDVRIEVGADKKVHAVLAAHDSAALSDLMRGQRSLERALSDAGIDVADGGIRFELSADQGRNPANTSDGNDGNGRPRNVWRGFNTVDVAVDAQMVAVARPWRSQRLDVVA